MPRVFPTPLSPGVIFCFNPDGNLRLSGKAEAIITGVCETDFSGYPDCRDEFVKALHHAVSTGMAKDIRFETPLMWLNKAGHGRSPTTGVSWIWCAGKPSPATTALRAMVAASAPPVTCAQTDSTSIWRTRSG